MMLKLFGVLVLVAIFTELSPGPIGGFPLVVNGERNMSSGAA